MKKHLLIFALIFICILLINCENNTVTPLNNVEEQNSQIALKKDLSDPYLNIVKPIIDKMALLS